MQPVIQTYITKIYEHAIFFYCLCLFALYALLAFLSFLTIRRNIWKNRIRENITMTASPLTPGISVIAPAYNEGVTIIPNVRSLLALNYPRFEVVIVNDGSTDDTLDKLVNEFELIPVEFAYHQQIPSQAVKRYFKSVNPAYAGLLIVDKENGKSKADAMNAGINAASFAYFLNTDVDCILDRNALLKLIRPFMDEEKRMIATGATLRMSNSCEMNAGVLTRIRPPKECLPRFQELEYIRSFVLGKMGWTSINAVPNVSGGLGMFDKEIVISAGGYDPKSLEEDMDMLVRMCKYMCEAEQEYLVCYIPETLCWTEGPATIKIFGRQRTRWARGLLQIFSAHRSVLFNPKYKKLGWIVFPYNFFFELLAPVIECIGWLYYIYIIAFNIINWDFALILLLFIYTFSVLISFLAVLWDQLTFRYYKSWREVMSLCGMAFLESFIYHPLSVFFAIKGYIYQLSGKKHGWGNMQRRGFNRQPANTNN